MIEVKSIDRKTFRFTDSGELLGELTYNNLFSLKAEIKDQSARVYKIEPANFFATRIRVISKEDEIASLAMTWSGNITITFQNGGEYLLKLKGVFSNKYIIENNNGDKLIQLETNFNWREFRYIYEVSHHITHLSTTEDILLILLGVYGVNYFISAMSGSTL